MSFGFPSHVPLPGRWCDLEPVSAAHLNELWELCEGETASFSHTRYGPYPDRDALRTQLEDFATRGHQPFWAVRPKSSGRVEGWLSICDVDQTAGAFEIGAIWYSPRLQRTAAATEAIYLALRHGFDTHGYIRAVWRCFGHNAASARAAERYGFRPEGIWRDGGRLDGVVRDVCWFSILTADWPARQYALETWLAAANFDENERALTPLLRDLGEST